MQYRAWSYSTIVSWTKDIPERNFPRELRYHWTNFKLKI
jgi:hypothetical protein